MKFISHLATGYNVVDYKHAREKNIPVTNVPTYATASVSQLHKINKRRQFPSEGEELHHHSSYLMGTEGKQEGKQTENYGLCSHEREGIH